MLLLLFQYYKKIITLLLLSCKFDSCTGYFNILNIPSSTSLLKHGAPVTNTRRCSSSSSAGYSRKSYFCAFTSSESPKEQMLANGGSRRGKNKLLLSPITASNHVIEDNNSTTDVENFKRKNAQLQEDNARLQEQILRQQEHISYIQMRQKIILESFEEKSLFLKDGEEQQKDPEEIEAATQIDVLDQWCDEVEFSSEECPVEPGVLFQDAVRSRAYWLVGLLAAQSCSGFILAKNKELLHEHPQIVFFLTMLIGAGGNAGNQASVRVIRGLALNSLNKKTQKQFLTREVKMAFALSFILSVAGFVRASLFGTPFPEAISVTVSLYVIVFTSICLGAVLPLGLKRLGVDPAHSSTTIQVLMDILGVILTVIISELLLDTNVGKFLISSVTATSPN